MITAPGIYSDIPESAYHGDRDLALELGRSLSASGAKTLLHSPARFAYERDHGRPATAAMDLGTLVHTLVLRSRDERIVVCPFDSMRTNAAKDWALEQEAAGRIVVSHKDVRRAIAVAKAVRAHPLAGAIFATGRPEVSLYWIDPETGVTCRGRIDWLRHDAIVDLKTVGRYGGSEPDAFGRQAASLHYPMSAAHYVAGYAALTGETLPFYTVTVEIEPPHFIEVGIYDESDLLAGHAYMQQALAEFKQRSASGVWTDPPTVRTIPVPGWYSRAALDAQEF